MEYTTLPKESKMAKQQKTYTGEFKREAVQLVKSSGKPKGKYGYEIITILGVRLPGLFSIRC